MRSYYDLASVDLVITKIAIVDDNPAIRKLIHSFVATHTDWEVCGEAGDGKTAITLAKCLKPDLIVLDLSMPVMNGLDAAKAITTVCPNSEMVLFTAHTSKELTAEATRVGIRAVLSKEGSDSMERLVSFATGPPQAYSGVTRASVSRFHKEGGTNMSVRLPSRR